MSLRFVSLSKQIADDWDRLVQGSSDGWAFSLTSWQRLILRVKEWQLREHSFAVYENGELVSVMPLQCTGSSNVMSSTGWGGSGPVLAGSLNAGQRERIIGITIDHAKEIAIQNGSPSLEIAISPVTRSSIAARWGINPFIFYGFKDASLVTQVIDLSADETTLFSAVSTDARRLMRRAADHGIVARPVEWSDMLDRYYEVHCETYSRTGVSPHPKTYFEGIAHEMAPRGHAALFSAFTAVGEPIAFVNLAWFDKGATYHTGCSLAEALPVGANYLVLWEAILSAKRHDRSWFEVGPIFPTTDDPKQEGLTRYKTKFGGEPHRYFRGEMPLPVVPVQESAAAEPVAVTQASGEVGKATGPSGRWSGMRRRIMRFVERLS